ncbi:helix-turn-helix transcriptional regulator [Deinococcus taeanensis]|uniref:helix-turn-helix transcriptional regulator n=1 Tax=Deinococcus taeanensis TaxID=2737050 RepID=UPI001CDD7901|nr:helix-turn-helix transcriptional regulator [Deinococcus taeanensis]UBV42302.1 helix-turn-helix transcriptional regulator [Deinococcus taeanensis]
METVAFPEAVVVGVRRRLLGISLQALAAEAHLSPDVLRHVEAGTFDPRSLHALARRVLARRLDITLA